MTKNKKFEPSKDVLQNVLNELQSSVLKSSDIVSTGRALISTKYSFNKKQKGKIELSKRNLDLLLDHTSAAYFADESGARLPWDSNKRQETVQVAIRTALAGIIAADEIGVEVEYIQSKLLEFINALRDNIEIQHLAYPVQGGAGWEYLVGGKMTDYGLALIVLVTSQEGLIPPKALVPNVDELYADPEQYKLLKAIELVLKTRLDGIEVDKTAVNEEVDKILNNEGDHNMANKVEELEKEVVELKEALEAAKNQKPATVEKETLDWKKAIIFTAAGVAASAAGMAAYNWFTDDTTTVTSRN